MDNKLLLAIYENDINEVKNLIGNGVSVHAQASGGLTSPLWLTVSLGEIEMSKFLISKGANVNEVDYYMVPFVQPLLNFAIYKANPEIVKLLIESGASLEAGLAYPSPLIVAVQKFVNADQSHYKDYSEIIKILLEHQAPTNVSDKNNNSAFHIILKLNQNNLSQFSVSDLLSFKEKWTEVVKMLINEGMDINSLNNFNETPLSLIDNLKFNIFDDGKIISGDNEINDILQLAKSHDEVGNELMGQDQIQGQLME